MMGRDYSYIGVRRLSGRLRIVRVTCVEAAKQKAERQDGSTPAPTNILFLRVTVQKESLSRFSFSFDGKTFQELGEEFVAREGIWIGAKVGLFAVGSNNSNVRGYADFEWVRVE